MSKIRQINILYLLNKSWNFNLDLLYFWFLLTYRVIQYLIWKLSDIVFMREEGLVVMALLASVRTSWKKGKIWVLKSRNRLKLAKTVILSFMYVCKKIFWYKLLRNITKFRLKPFLLLLDHFKVPQRQNEGKDKVKLMLKIAKPWSEASRDFLNSFRIVLLLKLLWDITTFNSKPIILIFGHINLFSVNHIFCFLKLSF